MPTHDDKPGPECLTDEVLADLKDRKLASEARARLHEHAANCESCRVLVAAVVRTMTPHELDGPQGGKATREASTHPAPQLSIQRWSPPATFGEFIVECELGRGAMGIVYLAYDRSLDRQVAVKFIATHEPSERLRTQFSIEARAIARLQHPNVLTIFRVGEVDGRPYIVSEYLRGQSLEQLHVPQPWRDVLRLGIGLARGLAAAHGQGVLHRDLKPANVLLTTEDVVKLLDFGLADLIMQDEAANSPTARTIAGTPRYMAPEVSQGAPATERSDLYSLGVLLYELCASSEPPPTGELVSPRQPTSSLGDGSSPRPRPPLAEFQPDINPDFARLIEQCLHPDPAQRVASAEDLCAALERLRDHLDSKVLPKGNPYRGLEPFEAEHSKLFFGRDDDIRFVLDRLRNQRLVVVAGDSGVGKSSLCRAGVLPRIKKGALDPSRDFTVYTIKPGHQPLTTLATVVAPFLSMPETELVHRLTQTPEDLGPLLRQACQQRRGLLLFIDQLEELVTLSEPGQVVGFTRCLSALALPSAGVRVLLTVRGDFLTRASALLDQGGKIGLAIHLLQPLSPGGMREAIVDPARSRGVSFEPEALRQLLSESTSKGTGNLPLLQFALAELWERRDKVQHRITLTALEEMGGVAGALSRHADQVLSLLKPEERQAARHLLGRLTTAEGLRLTRSESELVTGSPGALEALRALEQGRLLHVRTENGGTSYEIAHEALMTSWGTLRTWLDEDAGQRALRQRIETASAEWERLERTGDVLWRKRQLDEVRGVDIVSLGAREQAFLRASQRAQRNRQLVRWGIVALVVLAAGGIYGGRWWESERFIRGKMAQAHQLLTEAKSRAEKAHELREKSLELFDGRVSDDPKAERDPQELRVRAEELWDQALEHMEQTTDSFEGAQDSLNDALELAPSRQELRELLAEVLYERMELAERFHQLQARAEVEQHLGRLASRGTVSRVQDKLDKPATLELTTDPPGAHIEVWRYEASKKGDLRLRPHSLLGPTPTLDRIILPAGSYHLRLTWEGHTPVDLPLLLQRDTHERVHVPLPTTVPEGYVYIPPGCFLAGSAEPEDLREFQESPPMHRTCLAEGFFIGRTEVTFGDWLQYLETLPPTAPERHLLETRSKSPDISIALRQLPDGVWTFSLISPDGKALDAREGEFIHYPNRSQRQKQDWRRFPLTSVSANNLKGYLAWLDREGRLPGARLCNELEWTRAARGADDRKYPHGYRLQKDDANIDVTYGRRVFAFGPDEVGTYPASKSAFGILDMTGNAFEMVTPMLPKDPGDLLARGGAWFYEDLAASIPSSWHVQSDSPDFRLGVRLCASLPVARKR